MLRKTVCLAVLAAMFASTAEVEAQRRTPLRNLFRNVGNGWGTGNHWQTPGHDPGYYNSYSNQNSWQYQSGDQIISDGQMIQTPAEGQIIYENAIPQTAPNQQSTPSTAPNPAPATQDNSASRLLNQQKYPQSSTWQTSQQKIQNQQNWTPQTQRQSPYQPIQHPGKTSSIGDQTSQQLKINQYLKPYHTNKSAGTTPAVQLDQGGQFQIAPSRTPANNTNWSGR